MIRYIENIDSTNNEFKRLLKSEGTENFCNLYTIYTYNQSAGRGQQGNTWESEKDKNILFTTLFKNIELKPENYFILSKLVSIAFVDFLSKYIDKSKLHIKWPNDIYYCDKKLAGILIEQSLSGNKLNWSIVGIGLNVNQTKFVSDAPNPVSLKQILGYDLDKQQLMNEIILCFQKFIKSIAYFDYINKTYLENLYRYNEYFDYQVNENIVRGKIVNIENNGRMCFIDTAENEMYFYMKEIKYIV